MTAAVHVWIVHVRTESCDHHYYAFKKKPSERKIHQIVKADLPDEYTGECERPSIEAIECLEVRS